MTKSIIYFTVFKTNRKKENKFYQRSIKYKIFIKKTQIFGLALKNEVSNLSADIVFDSDKHPFLSYYFKTYQNFLQESAEKEILQTMRSFLF